VVVGEDGARPACREVGGYSDDGARRGKRRGGGVRTAWKGGTEVHMGASESQREVEPWSCGEREPRVRLSERGGAVKEGDEREILE